MACDGIGGSVVGFFIVPYALSRYGYVRSFRWALYSYVLACLCLPLANLLARNGGTGHCWPVYIVLVALLALSAPISVAFR
jgi:hypothetical protein